MGEKEFFFLLNLLLVSLFCRLSACSSFSPKLYSGASYGNASNNADLLANHSLKPDRNANIESLVLR